MQSGIPAVQIRHLWARPCVSLGEDTRRAQDASSRARLDRTALKDRTGQDKFGKRHNGCVPSPVQAQLQCARCCIPYTRYASQ